MLFFFAFKYLKINTSFVNILQMSPIDVTILNEYVVHLNSNIVST